MAEKNGLIAVIGPMASEIDYITDTIENKNIRRIGGWNFVSGTLGEKPVVAVRSFIGMANAAAATALLIENYSPRCVIIQGTCGGHNPKLHKGDIVIGESVIETCRLVTCQLKEGEGSRIDAANVIKAQIAHADTAENTDRIFCDRNLVDVAKTVPYSGGKLVTGCISSGDIWNREYDVISFMHRSRGSDCEEMEGFAVGQICSSFGVPFIDIRVLSNSELYDEAFDESLALNCQKFCVDFINRL
ncbi:MAG: 5'-methylthioadenosine/S-adenosylhomocysteine nucleosidase [Clostridiales bacterium]|nr:5'-methylthioadenosine/S-adenosylhomocysteine nucleosidase [Clostridiales bacterium]